MQAVSCAWGGRHRRHSEGGQCARRAGGHPVPQQRKTRQPTWSSISRWQPSVRRPWTSGTDTEPETEKTKRVRQKEKFRRINRNSRSSTMRGVIFATRHDKRARKINNHIIGFRIIGITLNKLIAR